MSYVNYYRCPTDKITWVDAWSSICSTELAAAYKAGPQIARTLSEDWCGRELYCPARDSNRITRSRANTPAIDFTCPKCERGLPAKKPSDMESEKSCVSNLLVIPRVFFTETVIEKRKPLSTTARRAGWVGCNILLGDIPEDGKIRMVRSGVPELKQTVRHEFDRVRGLAKLPPSLRGWTIDVLNAVRRIGEPQFSLERVYDFEGELQAAHPRNANVCPKIRQQLQVLRELGLIEFRGRGNYVLRE